MSKSIQIVCFDNPFPPNYGGVIDVFYKLKSLHDCGVNVYLHFFYTKKSDRKELVKLKQFCKAIFSYKRRSNIFTHISFRPFIVNTRQNKKLNKNLIKLGFPVLYEGLNTTGSLKKMSEAKLYTMVRLHNIEHQYYNNLANLEANLLVKMYYKLEALRLYNYQSTLKYANTLYSISNKDTAYFLNRFKNVTYLPVFQSKQDLLITEENKYCLFNGDLRISDNFKVAKYLIDVFSKNENYKLIIASSFINEKIINLTSKFNNIKFKHIQTLQDLDNLFNKTAIHILMSFQVSGIKLKLLNTLYSNSYVLVNPLIVEGTGLQDSCVVFTSKLELIKKVEELFFLKITEEEKKQRLKNLEIFNTKKNVWKIINCI